MDETLYPQNQDESDTKYTSLQRSMDIFSRLTNLSMEWNMFCFVGSFVSHSEKEQYWDDIHKKMAKSIVENIKSLKGCWVKLGQFLSTKSGFLPRYYLEELSQLQDYMPNSDFAEIIDTIEDDLGYMDDIFANFDTIPIASASIAQVHKATLSDGSVVAVKVQHKSSEQNLLNDIEILKMITLVMHSAGIYPDIRDYFDEYSSYAVKELDFVVETANIQYSQVDVYRSKVPVKVPKLYPDLCSKHVITMEYYDLHKFTDNEFAKKLDINMFQMIYDVHDFAFFQILSCGRFHSDPHPGNLQLSYDQKDKKVFPVFLDWGFTTHIQEVQRIGLSKVYKSVYTFDAIGLASALTETGFTFKKIYPYRYDMLFFSFINILLSSQRILAKHKNTDTADLKKSREAQSKLQELVQGFLTKYFQKAPNFLPLSFKVLSEYQSLSRTVSTFAPFLHLIYKNASFSLYSLYDSPLLPYYGHLGLPLLRSKLNSVREKFLSRGINYSLNQLLERLSTSSLKRNKNIRIFSELKFPNSKNRLESRLSDLLRYLSLDDSNLISSQVSVIHNGYIDVELSFGTIDKYEKRPISNECLFPLFTITSGLLAVSVLHLASIGKLNLDEKVITYWPEFGDNSKDNITIRDILEHRCGVIYTEYPFFDLFTTYENMVRSVEKAQFYKDESSNTQYMFIFYGIILSEIITRVTNVPAEQFLLLLVSMVGIDHSNFLFPNMSDVEKSESDSEDNDEADEDEEDESGTSADFTQNLNTLFQQSVSVFWENLPTFQLFNIPKPNPDQTSSSNSSSAERSDDSDESSSSSSSSDSDEDNDSNKPMFIEEFSYSDEDSDDSGGNIKFVSLDEKPLEPSPRNINIGIDEYRKNLSLESNVIDIPPDENGEIDSTYYCYCYVYDKDFPDGKLRRCYVPTKYCPTSNRLIRLFRASSADTLQTKFDMFVEKESQPTIDSDYCSIIPRDDNSVTNAHEDVSEQIKESFRKTFSRLSSLQYSYTDPNYHTDLNLPPSNKSENSDADETEFNFDSKHSDKEDKEDTEEIGSMGKLVKVRNKVLFNKSDPAVFEGFTLPDLVRFNCSLINSVNTNYPQFFLKSIPFLNARSNALSLTLFYYSILSGSLISKRFLHEVMDHTNHDHSLLNQFFTGFFKPAFSLGFQKFTFVSDDNNVYHGFGHSDLSGSVVMAIPYFNLCISVFVSHCARQHVLIKILQFILNHYHLKLLGYNIDSNLYKFLSFL